MAYEIRVEPVESVTIASVRRRATIAELSTVIPSACGEVWDFIRAAGIGRAGRWDDDPEKLRTDVSYLLDA